MSAAQTGKIGDGKVWPCRSRRSSGSGRASAARRVVTPVPDALCPRLRTRCDPGSRTRCDRGSGRGQPDRFAHTAVSGDRGRGSGLPGPWIGGRRPARRAGRAWTGRRGPARRHDPRPRQPPPRRPRPPPPVTARRSPPPSRLRSCSAVSFSDARSTVARDVRTSRLVPHGGALRHPVAGPCAAGQGDDLAVLGVDAGRRCLCGVMPRAYEGRAAPGPGGGACRARHGRGGPVALTAGRAGAFGPRQAGHHQVVRVLDQLPDQPVRELAVDRHRVPVPFVHVPARGTIALGAPRAAGPRRPGRT